MPTSKHLVTTPSTLTKGVGGRHRDNHTLPAGGGYLDNYPSLETQPIGLENSAMPTDLFFAIDGKQYLEATATPELGQRAKPVPEILQHIQLAAVWQRVAAEMGTHTFLELWAILNRYAPREGDRVRVDLPSKKSLNSLQRNAHVDYCAAQGLKPRQIELALKKMGYKDTSVRTVQRSTKFA